MSEQAICSLLRHGDPAGARTPDNRLKRQVLYQLSYRVICAILKTRGFLSRALCPLPNRNGSFDLERRSNGGNELSRLRGSERSEVCSDDVAGMAGIEPAMRESKSRALTAWLHPYKGGRAEAVCFGPAVIWGGRRDSNPRHSEPQSDALPTELRPPYLLVLRGRLWHA